MKTSHVITLILSAVFLFSCNQPVANSTLLSAGNGSSTTDSSGGGSDSDPGQLDIRPDNADLSASVEDTDKVEITGSCNDLDVKQNRIIVEAFSGENENDIPYVSNAISDYCQKTTILAAQDSTGNGIGIGQKCFWVTKGVGIIEDPNIPTVQKSFPQCHNGRFGFAVRLGGVLTAPAPTGSRYLVRFKIRTTSGAIKESVWNKVYVTRKLNLPSIDSVDVDNSLYTCTVNMSPARFNQNIFYSLTRSGVGANTVAAASLFPADKNSADITPNASAYSWRNSSSTPGQPAVISGATYTYTLTSKENTVYTEGFAYAPALTATGDTKTCVTSNPAIVASFAPTNTIAGTGATCYFAFSGARPVNPGIFNGLVTVRWAYSLTSGWTKPTSDFDTVGAGGVKEYQFPNGTPGCTQSVCTASESVDPTIVGNTTYYFAAQEIDSFTGLRGKWSQEVSCKPPAPQ